MLIPATGALASTSPATVTAGADAQILAANSQRNGLRVQIDPAAANTVYLLLRAGAASATNFDVALKPGGQEFWDGRISNVVWRGAVRSFSAGTPLLGVLET